VAALAATSGKDAAASARAHAVPETVRLGTTTVVGLERTLGHDKLHTVFNEARVMRPRAADGRLARHSMRARGTKPDALTHPGYVAAGLVVKRVHAFTSTCGPRSTP